LTKLLFRFFRKAVKIPVFANGNIQSLSDVEKCFEETGVDGVMSAEGCLHNPALFTGKSVTVWKVAEQYLQLVRQYPCPISFIRGHIFKLFHHCFTISTNEDLREKVAKAHTIEVFEEVTQHLKMRYQEMSETETHNFNTCDKAMNIPPFICQPYFRPEPKSLDPSPNLTKRPSDEEPSDASDEHQIKLSKKKLKRLNRKPIISQPIKEKRRILCALCPNPKGEKCDYGICRQCCRKKTYLEILDCNGMT
jgi:tRNA-dihydrouridine synthase 1